MTPPRSQEANWFYAVAVLLGLAFLATLLYLAWGNALKKSVRDFEFETVALNETLATQVRAAELAMDHVAEMVAVAPDLDAAGFDAIAAGLFARHAAVAAIGSYRADELGGWTLMRSVRRGAADLPAMLPPGTPAFGGAVERLAQVDAPLPTPLLQETSASGHFLLLRLARLRQTSSEALRILAFAIAPAQLIGQPSSDGALAIQVLTETSGVGGRQLIYESAPTVPPWNAPDGLRVLQAEYQTRLAEYSVRLHAQRPLRWADLDKALLLAAVVLGVGIALLFVALARAKDLQLRELAARNRVIEETVHRQTRELAETRDQAINASRVKSEFLASMSHEIRTPLNAVIGMAELLAETPLTKEQEKYVVVSRKAGEVLLDLVNDVLDVSKIEAGQLALERIEFSLREVVEQATEIHAVKADEKGLELALHVAPDVPDAFLGDPVRLRQIVMNLIGNAIKFTQRGEIVVRVERDPEHPDEPGRLLVRVADTGIGIPADRLASIFESFTQVDSTTTRKYGGTGLGLTICRSLAGLMDGRIWAESVLGEGSVFSFTVALDVAAVVLPHPVRQNIDLSGKRILVVDDNDTNRMILREMLNAEGASIDECADGPSALDRVVAAAAAKVGYDLVLLDCRMPGMDGFEVAARLRAGVVSIGALLMVTSSSIRSDLARAQELGLDGYLVKPVKRGELLQAVTAALQGKKRHLGGEPEPRPMVPTAPVPSSAAEPTARILLVEDNADNRLLIRTYLKASPYQVDEVENGLLAVEAFRRGHYDMVLMDIQMPEMDGHAATRAIRTFEASQDSRRRAVILALTANAIREDVARSMEAGCDAHLTKPIKKQALLAALQQYLSGHAA